MMSELKKLETLLTEGKVTRREFLARASALGLTAALSSAMLTTPARASAPKKGGRLRMGANEASTTDSLDPATIITGMNMILTMELRNTLTEVDHKANLVPGLAESIDSTSDAKKWIFKLRRGVEFHNGKTMDAEDVIFSINHHRKEESKSAAKALISSITEIRADGKYEMVVTLQDGNADFPFILNDYHLQIVPNNTTNFEDGMGTGGYILKSVEPGVRAFAKRNPNYWKEGHAHFDEVETLGINDNVSRTNALSTGQIDVVNSPDLKTIHMLEKKPGLKVVEVSGRKLYNSLMRTDTPPYDNNNVRLALKLAVDREQILKTILRGHGTLANDHPISPVYRYYASELPQREYDPEKARYLLKKEGLEGHIFNLSTAVAAFSGAVDVAVLFKESAAKAGIKINVIREPSDGYYTEIWLKKPWYFAEGFGRPTEDMIFTTFLAADAPWNETHWKHERFNKLLVEARAELNETKRREMYVEMQRLIKDEGGDNVFVFNNYVFVATTKLKYETVSGVSEWDNWRIAENWWFES